MGENTNIEWCDATFNPWMGCTKVSPACANCYAAVETPVRVLRGQGVELWGDQGERRRTSDANWQKPLKWNQRAICKNCGYAEVIGSDDCRKCGKEFNNRRRQRVFCASLADVFEDRPELAEWRLDLLKLIAQTGNLDWLLLTKRPENVTRMIEAAQALAGAAQSARGWLLRNPHVRIGTTVENQEQADRRISELLKIPAPNFLSCEPLLGPLDLTRIPTGHWAYGHVDVMSGYLCGDEPDEMRDWAADPQGWIRKPAGEWERGEHGVDWVIAGGESGPNARPMHPDWARSLRDQCQAAGVPFFFKQWGEWGYTPDAVMARKIAIVGQIPNDRTMFQIGKKAAGRLLDGREWNQFPKEVAA